MNKLFFYHKDGQLRITTPFCEMSIKLENDADMQDFIESLEYWGVDYEDMDKSYVKAQEKFNRLCEIVNESK